MPELKAPSPAPGPSQIYCGRDGRGSDPFLGNSVATHSNELSLGVNKPVIPRNDSLLFLLTVEAAAPVLVLALELPYPPLPVDEDDSAARDLAAL